jgi:hypothetical protein
LSIPLDAFAVTLRPGEPAEVVRVSAAAGVDAWRLHDIDLGRDFVAAVAYHGAYRPLRSLPTTDADGIASG